MYPLFNQLHHNGIIGLSYNMIFFQLQLIPTLGSGLNGVSVPDHAEEGSGSEPECAVQTTAHSNSKTATRKSATLSQTLEVSKLTIDFPSLKFQSIRMILYNMGTYPFPLMKNQLVLSIPVEL